MYFILIGALITISVRSNTDCGYGQFERNSDANNTCMFDCEHDNRYVAISTLSFNFIKEECSNIELAARYNPSQCNDLTDLVWSTTSCRCPKCKCSTRNDEGSVSSRTVLPPEKTCYNCTCSESSDSSITDLVYECDVVANADDPNEWNEFYCPPNKCTDGDGNMKSATSYWWENVDADQKCTKFCYCNGDGSTTCSDGFTNILGSSNDNLVNKFIYRCDDYIQDCMDDPSRMFTNDVGPYCGSICPKCDCGSHSVGDTWYTEYQDYYDRDDNEASCAKCICVASSSGNNYASCSEEDDYTIGYGSCPPSKAETIQCHDEDSATGTVGTLSLRNCTSNDDLGGETPYCDWSYSISDLGDGDSTDSTPYDWGCGSSLMCEAYANNKCISYDTTIPYTDCYDVSQTETIKGYMYCCNDADNCNHENIDITSCSKSSDYENFFKSYYQCLYSSGKKYQCDNYDEDEEITCDNLRNLYKGSISCTCTAYGKIYDNVGAASKIRLQAEIDNQWKSDEWNDVLGCQISLRCNLGAPGGPRVENNKGVQKVYFIAVLWIIAVIHLQ